MIGFSVNQWLGSGHLTWSQAIWVEYEGPHLQWSELNQSLSYSRVWFGQTGWLVCCWCCSSVGRLVLQHSFSRVGSVNWVRQINSVWRFKKDLCSVTKRGNSWPAKSRRRDFVHDLIITILTSYRGKCNFSSCLALCSPTLCPFP